MLLLILSIVQKDYNRREPAFQQHKKQKRQKTHGAGSFAQSVCCVFPIKEGKLYRSTTYIYVFYHRLQLCRFCENQVKNQKNFTLLAFCQKMLFYEDFRKPLAEAAEDLIIDSAGAVCDVVCRNGIGALRAHNHYFVADLDSVHICDIYHALIHADVADDRNLLPLDEYVSVSGISSGKPVSIAYGNSCYGAGTLCDELAAVAYRKTGADIFEIGDAGLY